MKRGVYMLAVGVMAAAVVLFIHPNLPVNSTYGTSSQQTHIIPRGPSTEASTPEQQQGGPPSSRSTSVSPWVGVTSPFFFYCSGAYLDERPLIKRQVVVPAIGQLLPYKMSNFTCLVEYQSSDVHVMNATRNITTGLLSFFYAYEGSLGREKTAITVHCAAGTTRPITSITIINKNTKLPLCRMPVTVPPKPTTKKNLGLCLSPLYSSNIKGCTKCSTEDQGKLLVPWLEMHKLLGVDGFIIYNHSMTENTGRVIKHYIEQGLVTDLHQHGPIEGWPYRLPNSVAVNDCMYRNLHTFHKLMVVDLDEFIIPTGSKVQLPLLLYDLADHYNVSHHGTHFSFANTLFYTDHPTVEMLQPEGAGLSLLRHRHRKAPQAFPGGCKSIIDPQTCRFAHAHLCQSFIRSSTRIMVDPSFAKLHHYKKCSDDWWHGLQPEKTLTCSEEFKTMVADDIALTYDKPIKDKVEDFYKNKAMKRNILKE